MALKTVGSNPTIHPTDKAPPVKRFGGVFTINDYSISNINIGVSSSGKTQHFDCCIRRFESCHPSQNRQIHFLYLLIFCSIYGRIRTVCPTFAKQKGHIIVASDKACLVESCHPSQNRQIHFLYLLIFCSIYGRIRTVCPTFAKQKGHIIVASDKACLVESCHPSHVVADFVSFATTFAVYFFTVKTHRRPKQILLRAASVMRIF